MILRLSESAARQCVDSCQAFVRQVRDAAGRDRLSSVMDGGDTFPTAQQLGVVYEMFLGEDLGALVNSFVVQAEAMAVLFAVAGGVLGEQDEVTAAALRAASGPGPVVRAPAVAMSGLGSLAQAGMSAAGAAGYAVVGPEDVSGTPLEEIGAAAQALDASGMHQAATHVRQVAQTLGSAASDLQAGLDRVLGQSWDGEFASNASFAVQSFTTSAHDLADVLSEVAGRAEIAATGFESTRALVADQVASVPGVSGVPLSSMQVVARVGAEEQARRVVHQEYSPRVMDANLAGLDFPAAYRVVAGGVDAAPGGVDPVSVWNLDGTHRPAGVADAAAVTAASADASTASPGGAGGGAAGVFPADGGGVGGSPSVDAVTRSAWTTVPSGAGQGATPGGWSTDTGAGGAASSPANPVNASTTPAGVPLLSPATGTTAGGAAAGAGGVAARSADQRRRGDRGFDSGAGALAGAGTLAGAGGLAGYAGSGNSTGSSSGGQGVAGRAGAGAFGMPGAVPGSGGTTPATSTGASTAAAQGVGSAARGGTPGVGMMPAGAMAGTGQRREGHQPAGYLVDAANTSELVGPVPKATPAVLGATPRPAPTADDTDTDTTRQD